MDKDSVHLIMIMIGLVMIVHHILLMDGGIIVALTSTQLIKHHTYTSTQSPTTYSRWR